MDKYHPGNHYKISDRSGFKLRASETVKEWNGLIVGRNEYEERHPQDFVRAIFDHQAVVDPRPDPAPRTVGPVTTALASEGDPSDTIITVSATEGMVNGDTLRVITESGYVQKTISSMGVGTATGGFHITLTGALNAEAAVGNAVIDISRVTLATEGF